MAPCTTGSRPCISARSVPKDQPTSQMFGRSSNSAYSMAAATSYFSPTALSNAPPLVPCSLQVPRVLKRSTEIPARAGSRKAALRKIWLSIMPPWVGNGCRQTRVATGSRSSGSASSPTRSRPSAVCRVSGSRLAGSTELARIAWDMPPLWQARRSGRPAHRLLDDVREGADAAQVIAVGEQRAHPVLVAGRQVDLGELHDRAGQLVLDGCDVVHHGSSVPRG